MKIIIYNSSILAPFEDIYAPLGGYTKILLTNRPISDTDFNSYRDRFKAWLEDCELILMPQALWDHLSKLIEGMSSSQAEETIPNHVELEVNFAPTHPLSEFYSSLEFVACYRIQKKQSRHHDFNAIPSGKKAQQPHDPMLYMNVVIGVIIMGVVTYLFIPHGSPGVNEIKALVQIGNFDKARKGATKIGAEKTVEVAIDEIVSSPNIDLSISVEPKGTLGNNSKLVSEYVRKAYEAIQRRDLTTASSGREPAIFYINHLRVLGYTQHQKQLLEVIIDKYISMYQRLPGKLVGVLNTELGDGETLRNFATEKQKKKIKRIKRYSPPHTIQGDSGNGQAMAPQ